MHRFFYGLFLSLLILTQPASGQERPDGVAVIIGNRDYKGTVPRVDYAHNDAEAIKRWIIEVQGFRPGNIIDLRNASQAEMLSVLGSTESHRGRLFQYVRPGESEVIVFYSGHGMPGLRDRRGYLLPVDGNPDTVEI
ncbi:MAG: caspase family protein, partial [Alphaproteobacteria bacterium]|nr:caspase family protein [Alphaproteobacteria bacterium]